jgi:hypothetical protein
MGDDKTSFAQPSSSQDKAVRSARGKQGPGGLSPAARRALAEAERRRAAIDSAAGAFSDEIGGRKGPEPVRYGDWESKGIASDF